MQCPINMCPYPAPVYLNVFIDSNHNPLPFLTIAYLIKLVNQTTYSIFSVCMHKETFKMKENFILIKTFTLLILYKKYCLKWKCYTD